MAKYEISWEFIQTGVSKIEAESLQEAIDRAEESVDDFGDREQFVPSYDDYSRWEVKSVEEIEDFSHQKVIDLLTDLSEIDVDCLDREEMRVLDERVEQAKEYLKAGC